MTRKEQKEERKKAILFTALELFVKRGYYDTKITDIAQKVSMSTGLLFHYFASKEELLVELVKMGAAGTQMVDEIGAEDPAEYFEKFLKELFAYSQRSPWVFHMFVLMSQARRAGMPEEARKVALSVDQIEKSVKKIELGQKTGVFREGDAHLLSVCFWTAVQGLMEEMAYNEELQPPNTEWLMAILRK